MFKIKAKENSVKNKSLNHGFILTLDLVLKHLNLSRVNYIKFEFFFNIELRYIIFSFRVNFTIYMQCYSIIFFKCKKRRIIYLENKWRGKKRTNLLLHLFTMLFNKIDIIFCACSES